MARIIDNKLLFIHVAKTGGTFVREFFNNAGIPNKETGIFEEEDHYSFSQCLMKDPTKRYLYSFGFVREPLNWMKSRWMWGMETNFGAKMQYQESAKSHWMANVWSSNPVSFLENCVRYKPGICEAYFNQMLGIGSEHEVNYIGKCETLKQDLMKITHDNGIKMSADPNTVFKFPPQKVMQFKYNFIVPDAIRQEIRKQNQGIINRFYNE